MSKPPSHNELRDYPSFSGVQKSISADTDSDQSLQCNFQFVTRILHNGARYVPLGPWTKSK
jgi:hypothetical protein